MCCGNGYLYDVCRRPVGANVRAGVCVEFRSKGSPARGVGGGVRASATAGDPSRPRPTIDFLTPGGGGGDVSRGRYFPFAVTTSSFVFGDSRGCTTNARPYRTRSLGIRVPEKKSHFLFHVLLLDAGVFSFFFLIFPRFYRRYRIRTRQIVHQ